MAGKLYRIPRRWPALVGAAAAGAVVAGVAASLGTGYLTGHRADAAAPATVTVTPQKPPPAAPLPTAKADRQTCHGWDEAGKLINEAADVLSVIPQGTTILEPSVRDDPDRTGAVQHAGDLFHQAADALNKAIAPGSTQALAEMAHTTVDSLGTLSTAYKAFDESSGDAITVARTTAHAMSGLCKRLVP
ncbi:hypothetical protein ACAG26_07850 [Mycobacterium sp. pUA109]|uniref:hypothetical protein n=1 Tax=Mycobacterium sp. pUA109 TaxID=3238982 RepID=UPI00351BAD7C